MQPVGALWEAYMAAHCPRGALGFYLVVELASVPSFLRTDNRLQPYNAMLSLRDAPTGVCSCFALTMRHAQNRTRCDTCHSTIDVEMIDVQGS